MMLNKFNLYSPQSTVEAVKLLKELKDVKLLAGGTFLINSLKALKKRGLRTPANIISLRRVKEMHGLTVTDGRLRIGAMTSITDIHESPLVKSNLPVLQTVCRGLGTTPIRNMATLGGNLACRYTWTEFGAVMVALDAQLDFISADGQPETITAETFFKNSARTDKLMTDINIPLEKSARSVYLRVNKSSEVDVPLLALCLKSNVQNNRLRNTRLAVNNTIAFAQRDCRLEDFLNHSDPGPALPEKALENLTYGIYKTEDEYKAHMFSVTIKNAVTQLLNSNR